MDVQWLLNLPQSIKGGDPLSKANLVLRAGDLLTASVLEVDKGRDALIAFGQFKAYARLPLPVVTGQSIQIQVQQGDKGLQMAMMPNSSGHPAPPASTGDNPQATAQASAKRGLTDGGRNPAPRADNPQVSGELPEKGMLQTSGRSNPRVAAPKSDNLQIRLFEPVSDRPFLSAHAHMLRPGQSVEGRITGFSKDGLLLVDFGKFKAFAKVDVPVREGQVLPLTVVKSDQGLTLSIGKKAATNTVSQTLTSPVGQGDAHPLTDGGGKAQAVASPPTVQGPPAASAPEAKTVMLQPSAQLSPPTAPEMAQLRDQIQQLIEQSDVPQKTTTAAPLPPTTQAALTHLQQLLRPMSATGDSTALMTSIREFVENSGVYFEKRVEAAIRSVQDRPVPMPPDELAQQPPIRDIMVKDLKPNLLILKDFLESQSQERQTADRHILETMKSVVQRTLVNIEHQQLGATEKPVDPDLFQAFSHLLMLADHRRDARLKVYYAKKGRRDPANKTPRVALLLEMDRMGTVRTDLWMVGKDLNITFFVQTPEVKTAISAVKDEIKTALNERFNTVAVSVVVNEKKIEQFDEEDLTPTSPRLLDLSV